MESNEWDTALINSRRQKFIFGVNNPTKIQYIDMKKFSTRFFFFLLLHKWQYWD